MTTTIEQRVTALARQTTGLADQLDQVGEPGAATAIRMAGECVDEALLRLRAEPLSGHPDDP